MFKKTIYLLFVIFLVTSCGNTVDSVKRGITGEKAQSTDEFFVQKKDPLILPPDYENLPTPGETIAKSEEKEVFDITLDDSIDSNVSSSGSTENSILKKIQSK